MSGLVRAAAAALGLLASCVTARALPATTYQSGMTQVEYRAPDGRVMDYMLIYPAVP